MDYCSKADPTHEEWIETSIMEQLSEMDECDELQRAMDMAWLIANDPNGCYSDHDSMVEFGYIITASEASDLRREQELG